MTAKSSSAHVRPDKGPPTWSTTSVSGVWGAESSQLLGTIDKLEHAILSHTGEDVFEEVTKLLFAKLADEKEGTSRFACASSSEETAEGIGTLFLRAQKRWPAVFPKGSSIRLPPTVLDSSVKELAGLRLSETSLSILDAALERLLNRSAKGAMGQYFTPRNVVSMCVDVLAPKSNEIVLDPACGSGGFLITALRRAGTQPCVAVGLDFDLKAFRVAQIMAATAAPEGRLLLSRRNSLEIGAQDLDGSRAIEDGFGPLREDFADVIVTNPPFGGDVTSADLLAQYECVAKGGRGARKMPRELLFIERCVTLLRPGGRAAIVVPQGVVANASLAPFREWLLSRCHLVGVVGLHAYAFLPHTAVKTSVLFLEKKGATTDLKRGSFFAVSHRSGKDSSGAFAVGTGTTCYGNGDDLRQIAESFKAHLARSPEGEAVFAVPCSAVSNDDVMAAERFDAEYFDPEILSVVRKMKAAGSRPMRSLVAGHVTAWNKNEAEEISYVDISAVDQRTGQILPSSLAASEAPSRASYSVSPGDVLVSTVRPDRNTVGLVTEQLESPLVSTNGFCVLRPEQLSSELLFAICKSKRFRQILSRSSTATMYPAVSDEDVLGVPVLPLPPEVIRKVETSIRDAHAQLASARRLIAGALELLDGHIEEQLAAIEPEGDGLAADRSGRRAEQA